MELPNSPSERDWTEEEKEEFFANLLKDVPQQPPIEWSTGAWNGPFIELDPNDPFGDMERIFSRGIHITSITPPSEGWLMSFYCPICKETWFKLSPWAIKPKDGDYFKLTEMCANPDYAMKHNLQFALKREPLPIEMGHSRIKSTVGRSEQ